MSYSDFFRQAYGQGAVVEPYPYQTSVVESRCWPELLNVPTGLGKTAAVTLAWLYKRGWEAGGSRGEIDSRSPRRLIWCLPMRVLVEQAERNIRTWLEALGIHGQAGDGKVSVHLLMGGEADLKTWADYPEEDMILIGTQDMLLSRALMRGYGMSRYQWPVHFALLHNDCLWAYDEVQLMGAGLSTSTQLEAFRRQYPLGRNSHSLWLSATLNPQWLETVDFKPYKDTLSVHGIEEADRSKAAERLNARKILSQADVRIDASVGKKDGRNAYIKGLCDAVLEAHEADAQTLVILNRVDRAQALYQLLRKTRTDAADLLIHARFRPEERRAIEKAMTEGEGKGRIIVATQAIEAGVDLSSKVLFTELAPWSSLVQRFGRCNRYGEHESARVFWIDITPQGDALPYQHEALANARELLEPLSEVGPASLPVCDQSRPLSPVLRRKDLLDLFNTDPDLSGFDVDVSDYIRDTDNPGLQVFWRDVDDPNDPEVQALPHRNELCPVAMGQAKALAKRLVWRWDSLSGRWEKLRHGARPGMVLMLAAKEGGYDPALGFLATVKKSADPVLTSEEGRNEHFDDDWRSKTPLPVALADHLGHVAEQASALCKSVGETRFDVDVVRAGRWHDLGKAHEVFDHTMHGCDAAPAGLLAKSPCRGRHERSHFRHELASMLGWLAQQDKDGGQDVSVNRIAYLIAAHHGKVRMSLRAMPSEKAAPDGKRFARGIWEGDFLPALAFDGESSEEVTLRLDLMELGEGEQGLSWTARVLGLLAEHGPFQLAWLETLVRIADWRASAEEQRGSESGQLAESAKQSHTQDYELEDQHRPLAQTEPRAETGDKAAPDSPQGGQQHGLRGRSGGSGDVGARTRTPDHATREIETTLGVISYAELANHLAARVEAVAVAIAQGEFDEYAFSEDLILELHRRICADLTPRFGGVWRKVPVLVGTHEPPEPWQLATAMRDFMADLQARLDHLSSSPDDAWLEALAFAEGRLLSIHPFQDFNGRVTRLFIDLLIKRLDLPDIEPIPAFGQPAQAYLDALRSADQLNWQPLMAIWKQRLAEGDGDV